MDWFPLWNTLRIALLSCIFVSILGIFFSYFACRMPRVLKGILDVLLTLPLVLPPTVCGYFLVMIFGESAPLSQILQKIGIQFYMTWYGGIISAIVVSFPLMYRTSRSAFEGVNPNIISAAKTLGLSGTYTFFHILLPNCKEGIFAGIILSFARILGEYGATSMLIGSIKGETVTISTTVYELWKLGDQKSAFFWIGINLVISAVVLLSINILDKKKQGGKR